MPMEIDDTSRAVLAELVANPRISMAELGRRVAMSAPSVTERVQRLEAAGVITGYRVELDPVALGMPVEAVVRVRPGPGQLKRIAELAQRTPNVVECERVTGEDCFVLRIVAPSIPAVEELLDEFLLYGQTNTSIVVSATVPRRSPPLDALGAA